MIKALQQAGFVERKCEAGEVNLNYVEGPPRGEPLLLLPGQTMPWESYQRVLPALSRTFHVYAVDIHGHGKSDWAPNRYNFKSIGQDLTDFIENLIKQPVIVSGNSSGGLIAVWLAAFSPNWVRAIVPEDPPLFSAEWPRLRDDTFAYRVFQHCIDTLDRPSGRDLSAFFTRFEIPVQDRLRPMKMPRPLSLLLSAYIKLHLVVRKGRPVSAPFLPIGLRVFLKGLSEYDPAFTRAFLDGSACDFDHADALSKVPCPMLLLHANWFRDEDYGLVGAMDDDDVAKVRSLVRDFRYLRVNCGHIIHMEKPEMFVHELIDFAADL